MFKGKNILITGGTGSFGKAFLRYCIENHPSINKLIIFSRDEYKQFELEKLYPTRKYKYLRFFLGDIRDFDRLKVAFQNVDYVIHAAALKHVPIAEYNPTEFIDTNIIGSKNVIRAAYECKVKKVISLSTDKASSPINLYGATKLCADKLFVSSNKYYGDTNVKFTVVRYGNVMGSRGSVVPFFIKNAHKGVLPITDKNMTRFNILMKQCIDTVIFSLKQAVGGELIVPKMPSVKITDLAKAINPNIKLSYIGIRPGEKIHEELISAADSMNTYDVGKFYIILPPTYRENIKIYQKYIKKNSVEKNFSYSSNLNKDFLKIKEIKSIISKNMSSFELDK